MKTITKVFYHKDGTNYVKTIPRNVGKNELQIELLKAGIGRSMVTDVKREQIRTQ